MSIVEGIVSFAIIWWVVLFAVLPWGVRSQHEHGTVEDGTEPGAPVAAHMLRKVIATTLIALVVWGLYAWLTTAGILTLDSIPGFDPSAGSGGT